MTNNHPVRRLLARLWSAETMSRIVDPTLADMRFERSRPSWRGYVTLTRALVAHSIVSTPGMLVRGWSDDQQGLPRAVAACLIVTAILVAPLVAMPIRQTAWLNPVRAFMLLSPQAIAVALPASLLLAIPLGFRRTTNRRRLVVRSLALSLLSAAAALVLIMNVVPDANQAFRLQVAERVGADRVHFERGPMEMTQGELRGRIEVLRHTVGEVSYIRPGRGPSPVPVGEVVRRFEYAYHLKLAMAVIAVPVGLLAIAAALSRCGRARPILVGTACLCLYILTIFQLDAMAERFLIESAAVSPAVLAWTPSLLLLLIAVAFVRRVQYQRESRP
jgi:hypothetical protein